MEAMKKRCICIPRRLYHIQSLHSSLVSIFPQRYCYQSSIQSSLGTFEEKIILNRNLGNNQMIYAEARMSLAHPLVQMPWGRKAASLNYSCPWMRATKSLWGGTLLLALKSPSEELTRRRRAPMHCKAQWAELCVISEGRNIVVCLQPRVI